MLVDGARIAFEVEAEHFCHQLVTSERARRMTSEDEQELVLVRCEGEQVLVTVDFWSLHSVDLQGSPIEFHAVGEQFMFGATAQDRFDAGDEFTRGERFAEVVVRTAARVLTERIRPRNSYFSSRHHGTEAARTGHPGAEWTPDQRPGVGAVPYCPRIA